VAETREFRLFIIPSLGEDIGKSNSDFPGRTTLYPRERHLIVGFSTLSTDLWRIEAFFHPHDLQTQVREMESVTDILTNSIDFGARTSKQFFLGPRYVLQLGADYFSRQGVDSEERGLEQTVRSLDQGEEHELGLNTSLSIQLRRAVLEAGARLTWFSQKNHQPGRISDSALSGFAGVSVPLEFGIELTGTVASGLRFPSLSEKFYNGTTGRGVVLGNPLLDSERSINADFGVKLEAGRIFASAYYFYNRISDYIERVDLEQNRYTFANLTRGAIRGLEWETVLAPAEGSNLYFRGHLMRGTDDRGVPLSDVPVHRFSVGFRRQEIRMAHYGAEWQFRGAKDDPGNGEKEIESANLLTAFVGLDPVPQLRLSFAFTNLLNEIYYPSADRKAAFSPGRRIAISLNWLPD
jgi:iron complex outermembrane receptor protein